MSAKKPDHSGRRASLEQTADDAIIHCVSERQARFVLKAVTARMEQVGLRLYPARTKIVCRKDANRPLDYEHTGSGSGGR
jgi:RNA-directed DNA polymerase